MAFIQLPKIKEYNMRAELVVAKGDKFLFVLKGNQEWIRQAFIKYRNAGYDVLIKEVQKWSI